MQSNCYRFKFGSCSQAGIAICSACDVA